MSKISDLDTYKQHLTLLLAYQSVVNANDKFLSSLWFNLKMIDVDLYPLLCLKKEAGIHNENLQIDLLLVAKTQIEYGVKFKYCTFKEFLNVIQKDYKFDKVHINNRLSIKWLVKRINRLQPINSFNRKTIDYLVADISYYSMVHQDISKLITWFDYPIDIPKELRMYIAASYKETVSGNKIWVFNKKRSIEFERLNDLKFSEITFEDYVNKIFPELEVKNFAEARQYAKMKGVKTQVKEKLIKRGDNPLSKSEVIGLGSEPIFKPKKVLSTDVVIDKNTSSEGRSSDKSILYTAGWSLKNKE